MGNQGLVGTSPSSARALRGLGIGMTALFAFGCASAPPPEPGDPNAAVSSDADTSVSSPPSSPGAPDVAPANQCSPTQFVGAESRCFDSSDAACASLKCAPSDCQIQETAPARARCR